MIRCKHCKGTEFGLTVVETKVSGFRAKDGEVIEQMGETEVKQETKISFCFGCMKPITEEDTYENETCPVCNKVVPELVNGKCNDCNAQVQALANMSKEELILMMLQGKMPQAVGVDTTPVAQPQAQPQKVEESVKSVQKVEEKVQSVQKVEEAPQVLPKEEVYTNINEEDIKEMGLEDSGLEFKEDEVDLSFSTPTEMLNDDDILARIDRAVDLNALSIMAEDENMPL